MNKSMKNLFPFPFKTLDDARVRQNELRFGKPTWQLHFQKAEDLYYSRSRRRKKIYLQFESHASKALAIAQEMQDLTARARTLSLMSRFQFEIAHPDCVQTLRTSIVAAQEAYGVQSKEAAIQMSGLCLKLEEMGRIQEADEMAWQAFQMIENNTSSTEKISLNDAVIEVALAAKDRESAVEAAHRGIRLTKMHVNKESEEYAKRIQYYESIVSS